METLSSLDFLEKLQEKKLGNIYMQYSDLSGREIKDVTIKNSKFFFVIFRRCTFKNVIFENCEFFFCAFGFTNSEDLVFKNCKMEYSGFTGATLNNSKFINTSLSWHSFIDTAPGYELRNCTEFHVFRKTEEIYPLIDKGMEELQPILQTMDFEARHNVLELLEVVKRNTKLDKDVTFNFTTAENSGRYEKAGKKGYSAFDTLIDSAVATYGTASPYKTKKSAYEPEGGYKK